jgi:type IV pilus assembly protein PilQ
MTSNEQSNRFGLSLPISARPSWGIPALAITMLAGTTQALAQNSGFGLLDAIEESSVEVDPESSQPREPVDFSDLEGSVAVNEYDLVDLHVNSEDLGAVLQLLSIQSQRNIISSNSVQASVTADLYGVTFYEALDAILHVNGFGYIEKGNFIYVYTREELEEFERLSRKPISRVINLDYLNSTDAAEFAKSLLSENGTISTSADSGVFQISDGQPTGGETYANSATLVVHDFEENVEEIMGLITELDTKPAQVLVEATILQTTLNEANAFGVDFSIISDLNFGDFLGSGGPLSVVDGLINGLSTDGSGADVPAAGADGDGIGIGSNIGNVAGASTLKVGIVSDDISVFLRVLDQVTDVTVVSNPKLLTLNRQPARVLVGTRVGYLNTTTSQTVEFLDVGTQLSVRPFVSKSGLIRLELRPQVSNFALRQITDNSGNTLTIPDEDTTEMNTNVMLRDGETAVLGGLFTESTTSTRRQVPVLGDIPLIGQAFRGNDDETRRTEIIFMITPSIVSDRMIADAGALGVDYIDAARVGARKSLLPFSRERRVGQLLIQAREHADAGDNERALFLVDRALTLSPQSPDARVMKSELSNKTERMPSRSIINGMLHRELLSGESRLVQSGTQNVDASTGTSFEDPEFVAPAEPEVFAEVEIEPLSMEGGETFQNEAFEVEQSTEWLTAELEPQPYEEIEFFEPVDEFGTLVQSTPSNNGFEGNPGDAAVDSFGDEPVYVQIDPEDMLPVADGTTNSSSSVNEPNRFDAMKSVATAEAEAEPTLPEDWYRWGEGTNPNQGGGSVQQNLAQGMNGANPGAFGGFLVIPLPGGGALHIEWPITSWDWANGYTGSTFTSVDTESFTPGAE